MASTSHIAPFGIVGGGRVARHFVHYLTLLGLPVRTWSRRSPGSNPVDELKDCGRVLVLIRDAAIVPFLDEWPALKNKRPIHFSGSLTSPAAHAAHPLMTFTDRLYDLETYRAISFVIDRGGPPFEELLPGLPNPSFAIAPGDRSYYHAMCVLAGNGSTLLWMKLFDAFENHLGIAASAAHPFLKAVAAHLVSDPAHALTGPLSRGDAATIQANLSALEGDPFHDVYDALVRAYARR